MVGMSAETLLTTKLLPPAARPDRVARARLIDRMDEGLRLGRRLTLVCAPPGFGKTTLIREWSYVAGRAVAWLTLDAGDNDPARFVGYVAAALQAVIALPWLERAAPATVVGSLANTIPSPGSTPPRDLLVWLINELNRRASQLFLVLDDYHALRDFAVHDLVAFLVGNMPPGLHLIVGTREDPPLPLARLRARDQVTEIRERALRFTTEEAGAFLNGTMGLELAPDPVAALAARTEGWAAGLQLAALALRQQRGDTEQFVAAFAGDDRYIADYLMAEVLDCAQEPVRAFLRQTAILERLSAPLCDALTGRSDAQDMLEQLEAANLFLTPLDNHREWYRYHVLFAEMLRLTLSAPERGELHKRAAAWFQAHGWAEQAMQHALLAVEGEQGPGSGGARRAEQPLIEPLSERELEILRLIADGNSNAEIGQRLHIATGTVKRHINNIYGKLDAGSRTQAIAKARALGLLP
jgi:LuxR family maltose regulon positive regulatory protein